MDRTDAIERLPPAYAIAIRLRDDGASVSEIAARCEMPVDAVPALLEIGERKLAALLATS